MVQDHEPADVLICKRCDKEYIYHESTENCLHVWTTIPLLLAAVRRAKARSKEKDKPD